jgi:hypothetical protein
VAGRRPWSLSSIGLPIRGPPKKGASIRNKGTHLGRYLDNPDRGISAPRSAKPGYLFGTPRSRRALPCPAMRLAIMRQPWVWKMARIESRQPENAVASASISSVLRLFHPRHSPSIWSAWFVSVCDSPRPLRLDLPQRVPPSQAPTLPLWVSDRVLIALRAPIGALNTREPSADDLASTPSASDTHPRSSRAGS